MKTLMWFEPERITFHKELAKNFGYNEKWAIVTKINPINKRISISNNIGDPECYKWTVDRVCKTLRDNKVELYREDNNTDPSEAWRILDESEGENSQGYKKQRLACVQLVRVCSCKQWMCNHKTKCIV